ncbi:MAG: ABC transporter permease [Thermomicrobiales bacterium]|nr:ABC transporter permease [Thermomicrobiales bacterium]
MSIRRILTIFRRDFLDAMRDARILVAILVPFGLGIFYNVIMDSDDPVLSATLVYTSGDSTTLPESIKQISGADVTLEIKQVTDEAAVRKTIDDDDADLGLVIPAGFDAAVSSGQAPPLTVIRSESTGFATQYLLSSLEAALRAQAGQQDPAQVSVETISKPTTTISLIEDLGLDTYFVLSALMMQIAMITMYAVPYILAEEKERRTLDALVMIASPWDVIAAKALFGLAYVAISTPLLLAVTRVSPQRALLFVVAVGLLAVVLDGIGLLLGSILNLSQLTTWGGVLILPVVGPAFVAGIPLPDVAEKILQVFPTTHAMHLAVDSLAETPIFDTTWLSIAVLAAWAVVVYAVSLWTLSRREA